MMMIILTLYYHESTPWRSARWHWTCWAKSSLSRSNTILAWSCSWGWGYTVARHWGGRLCIVKKSFFTLNNSPKIKIDETGSPCEGCVWGGGHQDPSLLGAGGHRRDCFSDGEFRIPHEDPDHGEYEGDPGAWRNFQHEPQAWVYTNVISQISGFL